MNSCVNTRTVLEASRTNSECSSYGGGDARPRYNGCHGNDVAVGRVTNRKSRLRRRVVGKSRRCERRAKSCIVHRDPWNPSTRVQSAPFLSTASTPRRTRSACVIGTGRRRRRRRRRRPRTPFVEADRSSSSTASRPSESPSYDVAIREVAEPCQLCGDEWNSCGRRARGRVGSPRRSRGPCATLVESSRRTSGSAKVNRGSRGTRRLIESNMIGRPVRPAESTPRGRRSRGRTTKLAKQVNTRGKCDYNKARRYAMCNSNCRPSTNESSLVHHDTPRTGEENSGSGANNFLSRLWAMDSSLLKSAEPISPNRYREKSTSIERGTSNYGIDASSLKENNLAELYAKYKKIYPQYTDFEDVKTKRSAGERSPNRKNKKQSKPKSQRRSTKELTIEPLYDISNATYHSTELSANPSETNLLQLRHQQEFSSADSFAELHRPRNGELEKKHNKPRGNQNPNYSNTHSSNFTVEDISPVEGGSLDGDDRTPWSWQKEVGLSTLKSAEQRVEWLRRNMSSRQPEHRTRDDSAVKRILGYKKTGRSSWM